MPLFHSTFAPLLFETHRAEPGDVDEIARLLAMREEEVAAVVIEPLVQGAAGMITHPPGYLRAVRRLCDRHGVLLICDEVATGFGRTGTMFACEQEGVSPDLLCVAKGLTGGYMPLAATLATERIYEAFLGAHSEFVTFFHGHTYTGNPLACAAAIASLEIFERERTLVRLQPKIRLLSDWLGQVERMREVKEVRQRGLMVGIDLGEHDPELRLGHRVVLEARRRGVIVRPLGDVIVLMPPLSISKAGPAAARPGRRRVDPGGLSGRGARRRRQGPARRGAARGGLNYSSYGSKSAFRAPQTGQNQSSGMSSNAVPGGTPPSGSPSSGS